MSRLDSHIRQKVAQRDSIDLAARRLAGQSGCVVEFGLGQGRSYSHLIERFPAHEVFAFDRRDVTPPGWGPPAERLYLGELADVLADPAVQARFTGRVLLAHLDLGSGVLEDTAIHHFVMGEIARWPIPGGWVLSDRPLTLDPAWRLAPVAVDGAVAHPERYHRYARHAG